MHDQPPSRRGFSLVELVIVVVIIGLIGAIAIPRLGSAAQRSKAAALQADVAVLSTAIEHFVAEHNGLYPSDDLVSGPGTDGTLLANRLLNRSDDGGTIAAAALWGPYLRDIPVNPYNRLGTIRIDGAAPGANTAGWRFDTGQRVIVGDHLPIVGGGAPVPAGNDTPVGIGQDG